VKNPHTLVVVALLSIGLSCSSDGPRRCMGDFVQLASSCQAAFDGTEEGLPACPAGSIEQQVWHCHDLIVLAQNHEAGSEVCYYDAVSRTLVGVTVVGDAGAYCDGTSATIEAGRVDNSCSANAPEFSRDCAANGGS